PRARRRGREPDQGAAFELLHGTVIGRLDIDGLQIGHRRTTCRLLHFAPTVLSGRGPLATTSPSSPRSAPACAAASRHAATSLRRKGPASSANGSMPPICWMWVAARLPALHTWRAASSASGTTPIDAPNSIAAATN